MPSTPGREPRSLAARLAVAFAAAAFLLVAAATGYQFWATVEHLEAEDDAILAAKAAYYRAAAADRDEVAKAVAAVAPGWFVRVEFPGGSAATPGYPDPSAGAAEGSDESDLPDGRAVRWRADTADGVRVVVGLDAAHDRRFLAAAGRRFAYTLAVSLLLAAGGGYWLARRGLRPLRRLAAAAARVRPTNLRERVPPAGLPAEVFALAASYNTMLDRLAAGFDRLAQFSGDLAHELRTPLNNLRGEAELALSRDRTPAEYRDALVSCLEETHRLGKLIDELLFLARADDPRAALNPGPVGVAEALAPLRDTYAAAADDAGILLMFDVEPNVTVAADAGLLRRAVGNLIANALAHTPRGGTVTVFARGPDVGVTDTGPGIAPEHLPHVFNRFYRGDAARTGPRVGLGLAIVKGIADLHGGRATAENRSPGAAVWLTFPGRA